MKLITKYSETTFGDTKAAKDLMLIADEIRTEHGIKGGYIIRKTFKIISKNILIINEINRIPNRGYRILLWPPYRDRYVAPELRKIELAGFPKLSTHAMTVLTSFYRDGLKKAKILKTKKRSVMLPGILPFSPAIKDSHYNVEGTGNY